jgi:hypothetical protein
MINLSLKNRYHEWLANHRVTSLTEISSDANIFTFQLYTNNWYQHGDVVIDEETNSIVEGEKLKRFINTSKLAERTFRSQHRI